MGIYIYSRILEARSDKVCISCVCITHQVYQCIIHRSLLQKSLIKETMFCKRDVHLICASYTKYVTHPLHPPHTHLCLMHASHARYVRQSLYLICMYSRLQTGWHRISRFFLQLFQRTRILPMGFTISTK